MRTLVILSTGQAFVIDRALRIGSADFCEVKVPECAAEHFRVDAAHVEALAPCIVGKVPMNVGQRRRLVAGCSIEAGGLVFEVRDASDDLAPPSGIPTREFALQWLELHDSEFGVSVPTVEIVEGLHEGLRLPLTRDGTYRLGRDPACSMALVRDMGVSRDHLEIVVDNGIVFVRDLEATGGTWMGTERLAPQRRALWPLGTMVRIGANTVAALLAPPLSRTTIAEYAQGLKLDVASAPSPAREVAPAAPLPLSPHSNADASGPIAPPVGMLPPAASHSAVDIVVYSALGLILVLSLAGLVWILVGGD